MEFSWIQQHVLNALIRAESARVKELVPDGIPANQFSYHLDGLVAMKLIEKIGRGEYRLTPLGEKKVGSFSTLTKKAHENIKTVIMLYSRAKNGYLLFKWSRQPYMGKVTPVYDRMPIGKSLADGIASATIDKLGSEIHAKFKTSIIVRINRGDVLISHMHALVYEVDISKLKFPIVTRNGEAFIGIVNDIEAMKGLEQLFECIENQESPSEVQLEYSL